MKNLFILISVLLLALTACKTTKPAAMAKQEATPPSVSFKEAPAEVNWSDQDTWLLGYFTVRQLSLQPYSSWYNIGFDEYQLNTEAINKLIEINKDELSITIVMGTWCPDSRREVPRFMRVLEVWQFPGAKVKFIGVDNAKLSPVGEYDTLNIERVPTFIIYKNNIEAGRIIENPKTSLEQDIVNILGKSE